MNDWFDRPSYFSAAREGSRSWEKFYRNRWQYDKEVRSTHGVNCTGSCSWRIFTKKGIVTWELQQTDYPKNRPGCPDYEPRGCPRGASYSWYLYNSGRIKHPMIRRELLDLWEKARAEHSDPVLAWGSIVEDKAKAASYKRVRGLGGLVRTDWDTALEIMAAANIYTAKRFGPDRNAGFTPIPAFSQVSYASGVRYLSLIGGTSLSFYDFYCDLPPSSPQTWGEQTDVPESADWYNSSFLILWGSNVPVTRTPDSPFLTQVRYKGTQVAVISPDYSDASKFADVWLAPKQGTDSALGMAMGHVILTEFFVKRRTPYFDEYVRKYTDLPYLVKLEQTEHGLTPGRILRASDFPDGLGIKKKADFYPVVCDEETGGWAVPNGSIGSRWNDEGKWNLRNEDVRTGAPFTPRLSMKDASDAVVTVAFPYFGGEAYRNPNFAATAHGDVLLRRVPVRCIAGKDGEIIAASIYDLMLAQYGVDTGLGDKAAACSYGDDVPYTPAWQEKITGVPAERVIKVARQFARTAEKTRGRAMIIIGAGVNQWYNTDMTYRAAINILMLCGTVGVNGGGWAHYVGQEKVRAQAGWSQLTFALDWIRPARQMNTTSWVYMHSDQWRYEKVSVASQLSPLAKDRGDWEKMTLLDCNIRSQRLGWLPAEPELSRNPLELAREAAAAGKKEADYVSEELAAGRLALASEDIDAPENSPKCLFVWRANLVGCSAKGMEYFVRHMLGGQDNVLGKNLEQCGLPLPEYTKWRSADATGKLDLMVSIDFRMTTTGLHADIVLPAATWYEKADISSTDMHPFLHPFSKAVDPVWESRTDWEIFKALAKKFSELCPGHLGVEKDIVMSPLMHDSPAETAAPLEPADWRETGEKPVPGVTMGNLVTVVRDYPATYARFTSVGPLLRDAGIGAKGIAWKTREDYELLRGINGTVEKEGPSKGLVKLESDIDAVEMILKFDPAANGAAGRRAWKALEKPTGLALADRLTAESGETMYRYRDLQEQPRRALNSPVWSGVDGRGTNYTANWTNVNCLIPWRTLTGRQSFYLDHPWMLAFGEGLAGYKPPLSKHEIGDLRERLGIRGKTLSVNLLTPHNKWTTHSTWSDNLIMLTLGRGGPVIWMSEKDAAALGIRDNDWVEALNDNGSTVARACVSQRIPQGAVFMYHNQGRTVNVPLSPATGHRGGLHNSISRICPKPTHMVGGYAQLSWGMNYYGTIGANRDEFVLLRRLEKVDWE